MKSTGKQTIVGIDIGTDYLRACIHNDELLEFVKVPASGIQSGNITNVDEFSTALTHLVNKIYKNYNIKKINLIIGVSGSTLNSGYLNISATVNNKDSKVGETELSSILEKNENIYGTHSLSTLYHQVRKYRLNGQDLKVSPIGLRGSRLDAKVFSAFVDTSQILLIETVCKNLKLEILDIIASPMVEADLLLSNKQKLSGVAILNIGISHSSLIVYEGYSILAVGYLSFGSQELDNKIALGLKVSLEEAYDIRQGLKLVGYNKKKYEEIVESVMISWTDKVNEELDIIKRKELLPAGIMVLGEVSNMIRFESLFKSKMKLPIKLDRDVIDQIKDYNISNTEWLRPLGLSIAVIESKAEYKKTANKIYNHIRNILCQFLP